MMKRKCFEEYTEEEKREEGEEGEEEEEEGWGNEKEGEGNEERAKRFSELIDMGSVMSEIL